MTCQVVVEDEARDYIPTIGFWSWSNRRDAPSLFAEELERSFTLLSETPNSTPS